VKSPLFAASLFAIFWNCTMSLAAETFKGFEDHTIQFTGGEYKNEEFHYRLLRPDSVKPDTKYPLVVFLHGAGERGTDNKKQLQYLPESMSQEVRRAKYPCFVFAPQCRDGRRWVEVDWGERQSTPMAAKPGDQMQMAIAALEQVLKSEPIDRTQIYLTGLSMGGYGSWELAARRPELFAAVTPICGGGDEATAKVLAALPIWVFHGDADRAVPVIRSRKMVDAIKAADGNIKYTEYPGVGHNSWGRAYSDDSRLLEWMFKQRRK
jgi:predicted peptidase